MTPTQVLRERIRAFVNDNPHADESKLTLETLNAMLNAMNEIARQRGRKPSAPWSLRKMLAYIRKQNAMSREEKLFELVQAIAKARRRAKSKAARNLLPATA